MFHHLLSCWRHLGIILGIPSSHQPVCSATLIIVSILYFLFKPTTTVYREMALPWHPDALAWIQTRQVGKDLNHSESESWWNVLWSCWKLKGWEASEETLWSSSSLCFPMSPGSLSWARPCLVCVWDWQWLIWLWISFSFGLLHVSKLGSQPPVSLHSSLLCHPYHGHSDLTKHISAPAPPYCPSGIFTIDTQYTSPAGISLSPILANYSHIPPAMFGYLHVLRKVMCSACFCIQCCLYVEHPLPPSLVASYTSFKTSSDTPSSRKDLLILLL